MGIPSFRERLPHIPILQNHTSIRNQYPPVSADAGDFFVPFRISYQHHVVFSSPASSILSSYAARTAAVA